MFFFFAFLFRFVVHLNLFFLVLFIPFHVDCGPNIFSIACWFCPTVYFSTVLWFLIFGSCCLKCSFSSNCLDYCFLLIVSLSYSRVMLPYVCLLFLLTKTYCSFPQTSQRSHGCFVRVFGCHLSHPLQSVVCEFRRHPNACLDIFPVPGVCLFVCVCVKHHPSGRVRQTFILIRHSC